MGDEIYQDLSPFADISASFMERSDNMITLAALIITLIILAIIAVIVFLIGGTAFLLTFGDVIIAIFIISLIVKHFLKKKKKN